MNRFEGKIALVCGAASGIGAAVTRRFADEGARIAAIGLPQPADFARKEISTDLCDVTDDAQVRSVVASVHREYGRIDILVNAAGVVLTDDAGTIDDSQWQRIHDVNLGGAMRTMRAALPHMTSQRSGAIVNIASVAAFNAGATQASYAAAKAGLVALTRSTAQRYGEFGIRANALCPGWVDTPMSQREMLEMAESLGISVAEARTRTVARIALGRMATADEIATVCLFLASDDAAFVTGAALVADGGMRIPASTRAV